MEEWVLLWWTLAIAVIGYLIILAIRRKSYVDLINKLPGPYPIPFVGNLSILGFRNRAMKFFDKNAIMVEIRYGMCKLYEKEKMVKVWIFQRPAILLYGAESVEPIMASNVSINKGAFYKLMEPWLGQGLVTSSGSKWRSRRKMLTPSFHFQILQDFLPVMNDYATILIQKLTEASKLYHPTDVLPILSMCTLDIICETAMGTSINAQNNTDSAYVKAIHSVTRAVVDRIQQPWLLNNFIYSLTENGKKFKKDVEILHDFSTKVIRDKKAAFKVNNHSKLNQEPTELDPLLVKKKRLAFLDVLLEKHFSDDSFTEEDIREEVDTFMFAGHDTTSTALTWALYLIGLYPKIQQKLQEEVDNIFGEDPTRHATLEDIKEIKYMELVLKESQRLYPSVPGISRVLAEDTVIEGKTIPKGTNCLLFTYALHHNPEYFPNPEEFDPDRFLPENSVGRHPYAFIPFSAGPRNCIGQRFALMEQKVLLSFILRNFTVTSLDQRDSFAFVIEVVSRPSNTLRLKFEPRKL